MKTYKLICTCFDGEVRIHLLPAKSKAHAIRIAKQAYGEDLYKFKAELLPG